MSIGARDKNASRYSDGPRLLADVGGTHARFVLELSPGEFAHIRTLAGDDFAGIAQAIRAYLDGAPAALSPHHVKHAAIAIANPVEGDRVRMTNRDWHFSIERMRQALGLDTLLVVNDFIALAMAVPQLDASAYLQLGGGKPRPDQVIAVIGPGTGLGVSALVPVDGRWLPLASEGGHVSFAPADARELAVLQYAWRHYPHVSFERLVSGPGIALLYRALASWHGKTPGEFDTVGIVERAQKQACPLCVEAIDCFCATLGTFAANVAVTLNAGGGVYIGGGVVPKLGDAFNAATFRRRFEAHGRYKAYLANIPVYVINAAYPALTGASALLGQRLRGANQSQ